MNRVLKYLKKHKIGKRLLSLLLCLLTVVCFGGILEPLQAHAVTGVEEIITFVIGILIACGVTFTSAEAAQSTARRYYNSVDSDTKSIIDKAKEQYDAKKEYYTVTTNGLIMCLASEWQKIFDSIASFIYTPSVITNSRFIDFNIPQATFKNYDSFVSMLQQKGSLEFDFNCNSTAYSSFCFGNTMIELIGTDVMGDVPSEVSDAFSNWYCILKITILGTGYTYYRWLGTSVYFIGDTKYYDFHLKFYLSNNVICTLITSTDGVVSYNGYDLIEPFFLQPSDSAPTGGFLYYCNHLVTATGTTSSYSLNIDSIGNFVCDDGTIFGTDFLINCDPGFKINDSAITKAFTCDPSISIGNDYIGTDTSWTDSVADAGSGSIAFPLDVDDLIDLSPSDVRDKTLTDTGDIATDKTDDTKDDTKDNPNTKPKKPSIPSMSLPEILFKEKFPFCLPWDIYNLFSGLQAEAEAPRFVMPFKFERLGIDEEIVIDFSDYEEQIKIIRFFTGAMFVLALVMISRKIIGAQ